jgi:N-methylhydantoinase B
MPVDAVTLEVIRNRLDSIADEMQTTLKRTAYSIVLKEGGDCSCAIFTDSAELLSPGRTGNPGHLGALLPAARRVIELAERDGVGEGDVYVLNDPYDGGTHLPDVVIGLPIFWEGSLIALGLALAHHSDMGGRAPGSMAVDSTEVFQEGLIIPPLKLYSAGQPNESVLSMIARNVRIPHEVLGDLSAQIAASQTAARRIHTIIEESGPETFREACTKLLEHSEALMRDAIATIPDGSYSFLDYVDSDGIDFSKRLPIQVTITIDGSNAHIDFTGSSPQVRGAANTAPGDALGPVYFVFCTLARGVPRNSGSYRPITVEAPLGSILHPRRPAAVAIRYHTLKRVFDVLCGALAQAIPDQIPAAGDSGPLAMNIGGAFPSGDPYVYMECNAGGSGATARHDGVDNLENGIGNGSNDPVEAIEVAYPLRVWTNRLRIDSGGAGRQRGGLGTERVIELLDGEATASVRTERYFTAPWGLAGGQEAMKWEIFVERSNGVQEKIRGRGTFSLQGGDRIRILSAGGGGYGLPGERDIDAVRADVRAGKVSLDGARRDYNVVFGDGEFAIKPVAVTQTDGS